MIKNFLNFFRKFSTYEYFIRNYLRLISSSYFFDKYHTSSRHHQQISRKTETKNLSHLIKHKRSNNN